VILGLLGVIRTQSSSIGDIELRNPWTETTWRWKFGFTLVHWHQRAKHPLSSGLSDPEHTWRLYTPLTVRFIVQYGIAPFGHEADR
jgi:hypothetical protein